MPDHHPNEDAGSTAGDPRAKPGEAALYALFRRLGIAWEHHDHPPFHTVEESRALRGDMPGAHVKNMFLKDRSALWLVTCLEDRRIRIRDLERAVGAKGMSFGKPDLLREALGVSPGAVTPFALLNDPERRVRFVLDRAILGHDRLNAHPLHNEATSTIATADLARFLDATGHRALEIDFERLEELARTHAEAR